MGRGGAPYMTDPVMDELEARGYPFADRRGARGVSGNGAVTYYRFVALRHGSISLEELRLFYEAIPSRGPWLMHGAKKLLHDMDREQRRSWHVKLPQLVDFGATEMRDGSAIAQGHRVLFLALCVPADDILGLCHHLARRPVVHVQDIPRARARV